MLNFLAAFSCCDLFGKPVSTFPLHASVQIDAEWSRTTAIAILRDHVAHRVEHAIASGDKADQRRKIAEWMDVIGRADR